MPAEVSELVVCCRQAGLRNRCPFLELLTHANTCHSVEDEEGASDLNQQVTRSRRETSAGGRRLVQRTLQHIDDQSVKKLTAFNSARETPCLVMRLTILRSNI